LLVASGASYALGGGFSLDARKKYPFVPLLLWLIGWLGVYFKDRLRIRVVPAVARCARVGLVLVLLIGVAATWTTLGLVRFELHRFELLVDYIKDEGITGDVELISSVDVYSLWPSMRSQIGWRLDDTESLQMAVGRSELRRVETGPESSTTRIFYDGERDVWTRE
jgi:hypothetical protein